MASGLDSPELLVALAPLGVLLSAAAGSGHCAAMCGPLVLGAAGAGRGGQRHAWLSYQVGRTFSYGGLGALAGGSGRILMAQATGAPRVLEALQVGLAACLALWMAHSAVSVWRGEGLHRSSGTARGLAKMQRWIWSRLGLSPLVLGLGSALLPCGYLHLALASALATQDAWVGAAWLAIFAQGTAPGLFVIPWAAQLARRRLSVVGPRFSAVLLLVAGLTGLGARWWMPHVGHSSPHGATHAHGARHDQNEAPSLPNP